MKKIIAMFTFGLSFALTVAAFAHEGHQHKVMGTVASVDKTHVEVKAIDGKTVSVEFTSKTIFHKGDEPATQNEIKIGERIVLTYMTHDGKKVAHEVQLPPAEKKEPK